jgi:AAA domain
VCAGIFGFVQGEIIEFWRAVEMFSPPSIPAARPSQNVFDVVLGEPLPWSTGHPLRRQRLRKHQTWRHIVYVGTYPREAVFSALRSVFPAAADSFEERPVGSSALLAFAVSDDGKMLEGSVVLSAGAWATTRALDPGPAAAGWLDGFDGLEAEFATQLEEMYLGDEQEPAKLLDATDLTDCCAEAIVALGVADVLSVDGIRVRSEKVARETAAVVEHDFLNSFIADDLARVAGAAHHREVGPALRDYLRPGAELDAVRRVDVRTELDEVRHATAPDRVPLGRWPAAPDRPLALGQQLAVNEAVAMPRADAHLFAVNGPPGTGKTTMLRDLIAALVTERAERLAALPDPADAFAGGEPYRWQTKEYRRVVHRLKPELTGFELVVASSNNGAVENVTLEIPSAQAIDAPWRERAQAVDYFPALAERAMGAGQGNERGSPPTDDSAAWALTAARLGNSKNRRDFVDAVWWTERRQKDDKRPPPPPGLRDLLTAWEKRPEGDSWAEAVAAFKRARDRATTIRDDRLRTAAALDRLAELESQLDAARESERTAAERAAASGPRREQLEGARRTREDERRRRTETREEEARRRPFVLRFRARAAWQSRDEQLAAEIAELDALLDGIGEEFRALEADVRAQIEARAAAEAAERELDQCRAAIARYREQPGAQLPDDDWYDDRQARELQAPWTDAEWNEARSELFLAALDLHRAFLVHAAQPLRETLDGAMEIVAGKAPPALEGEAALAAWQALFLVVPVVSTTFASVPRLFRSLGAESLGWLLVDEAGQATPQNAVGALWRCRRAVVVGDPQQLEPIVTIPFEAEQAIRAHYGVDEEWLTGRGSAQSIADRCNRLGTTLPGPERPVWVGAPLAVHRRCDRPMFELSNAIAYDGLMIDATDLALAEEFAARYPSLPQSKWIDVRSQSSQGHWVPAEGAEVDGILAHLNKIGFDFSQAMAIGPFRDVARQLGSRSREHRGLRAGTIHTAQGKEADIVILVLGSDPARDGARAWAAGRPNLLNVAVSRARRRLYVIGDREAWMRHRYFGLLADGLPHDTRT